MRRATLFLIGTTTIACVATGDPGGTDGATGHKPARSRGISGPVLGIWSFTNLELALGVLRVDERLKAYAIAGTTNVLVTVAASVVLVVGFNTGYIGLLIANYGPARWCCSGCGGALRTAADSQAATGAAKLPHALPFRTADGPGQASVYALSVLDRQSSSTTRARPRPVAMRSRSRSPARSPSSSRPSSTRGRRWPTR